MTNDLEALTLDELYFLRLDVVAVLRTQLLAKKKVLLAKKKVLEKRLQQLQPPGDHEITQSESRRPYPAVSSKFRNPNQPSETWSGRGKRPGWLDAQLRSGKRVDDFRIERASTSLL